MGSSKLRRKGSFDVIHECKNWKDRWKENEVLHLMMDEYLQQGLRPQKFCCGIIDRFSAPGEEHFMCVILSHLMAHVRVAYVQV